jgi:hypothetical protein
VYNTKVRSSVSLTLAFLLGALSYYLFVPICGIVKAYIHENYTHNWVFSLSPDIRHIAMCLQWLFEEFLAAFPVCGSAGMLLGLLIKGAPLLHGFAASLGAICVYVFYSFYLFRGIFPFGRLPEWFYIGEVIIWLALFMCITRLAFSTKKRVIAGSARKGDIP